jgi:NADPH:quinone reductase-like Zn-dependent oxidoreductase
MFTTEAWVIRKGSTNGHGPRPAELRNEAFSFPDISSEEVLVEPIYGCWEGNMAHALTRSPVDICDQRKEEKVVIGNAGVVRVLKIGDRVQSLHEGDLCLVFCNGVWDDAGYPKKIFAYDAPGTTGLLAKQTKLHERQLIPIPANTQYSLAQWAAFSLRYITAWANWKVAYGCLQVHQTNGNNAPPIVWGWGGGVAFAETTLAKLAGCDATLISSSDYRLSLIKDAGINAVDRRNFSNLNFDDEKYKADPAFRSAYQEAEEAFLETVKKSTGGRGVSIFIDYIGLPVIRATLKALGRPGVITTAGWKQGMNLSTLRAIECMNWHVHVHTHYARYAEGQQAVAFAEQNGWMPPVNDQQYSWDDIPQLANDYASGKCNTYFPLFQINQL